MCNYIHKFVILSVVNATSGKRNPFKVKKLDNFPNLIANFATPTKCETRFKHLEDEFTINLQCK